MTLVVAKKFNGIPEICCDTGVTYEVNAPLIGRPKFGKTNDFRELIRVTLLDGVLKTIILRPDLVVSYAGTAAEAIAAINFACEASINGPRKPFPELLQNQIIQHCYDADFLLTYLSRSEFFVVKITKYNIKKKAYAWIGDVDAFNEFNRRIPNVEVAKSSSRECFWKSFLDFVTYTSIETVSGFLCSVYFDHRLLSFVYREMLWPYTEVPASKIKKGTWRLEDLMSASDGTFTLHTLVSHDPLRPAIAYFILEARMGLVFERGFALKNEGRGKIYLDVDYERLRSHALHDFSIELYGMENFFQRPRPLESGSHH